MKQKFFAALITLLLLPGTAVLTAQPGYSVTINIAGASDEKIRLAYHLGNQQYISDSTITDKSGFCRFSGADKLPAGVYMIVLPGNHFFEFLLSDDQHFDISCELADPVSSLSFRGSVENDSFLEYQKNWKLLQEQAMDISEKLRSATQNGAATTELRNQLTAQEKKMKQFLIETAERNKGTLLGAIALSIIPVEPVIPSVPEGIAKRDSIIRLMSYLSYKEHFFDNIDFSQPGLIRSPVLAGKLEQFFGQVVIQMPDSIIKEADRVIKMSEAQREMFQYVAVWLFNRYATSEYMGHDAVVVHLADSIYLSGRAPWITEEYRADLAKRVEKLRPTLIGRKATELIMNSFAGHYVSLYDVDAEFTILYFWEPDCGHCAVATPLLSKYYNENRDKGIEVFAVCTQSDREKWEKYIVDNGLTWINGWDPQRLSRFDVYYNVESTPLVYILDSTKTIIAKRLSVEDIGKFIDNYRMFNLKVQSSSGR